MLILIVKRKTTVDVKSVADAHKSFLVSSLRSSYTVGAPLAFTVQLAGILSGDIQYLRSSAYQTLYKYKEVINQNYTASFV